MCSCHKYEEGPQVSFRTTRNAIKGNWKIASYRVDGVDSMWVIERLRLQGKFDFFTHRARINEFVMIPDEGSTDLLYRGGWSSWDGKNQVELHFFDFSRGEVWEDLNDEQMPFKLTSWQILRLKNNQDMWLKAEVDGKQYELKFKGVK